MAILLMAFALRVGWLGRSPLWWDEGLSAYLSGHPPLALIEEMRATDHADPPIYQLVLSGWRALAGPTPFSLRYFSALMSVLGVALTWAIGRWLTGRWAALLGTLLVALAPMQVVHAREAKSYAFALAAALLSTYTWGRGLGYAGTARGKPVVWWVVYVLSTAAALGSHYYASLLVLWQTVWVAGSTAAAALRQRPSRRAALTRFAHWALAMGAVALLLAPPSVFLFAATVQGVNTASTTEPLSLPNYLGQVALDFGAGTQNEATTIIAAIGVSIFAIVGALNGRRRLLLSTWVTVPLAAAYAIQARYSFFFPRFLLYMGPALYILVAQGIASVRHRKWPALSLTTGAILAALIVGLWTPVLARAVTMETSPAEDPRPAIAHIRAQAQPGDALVYVYVWQAGYIESHYPDNELSFYQAPHTPDMVAADLAGAASRHPRLWLLSYQIGTGDPHNLPAAWLATETYKVEDHWYGDHNLALYLAPGFHARGIGPDEAAASFGGRIEARYPVVDARLHPGDAIALPLQWRALTDIDDVYKVFVHIGTPGVPPVAQSDGEPQDGLSPTSTWQAGQETVDRRGILLSSEIPPGRYEVLVGLYRASDGSRLEVDGQPGSDAILVGYVEVEP
jgi:mannosyltransferase